MSEEEFEKLLKRGYEKANVEFKGPGSKNHSGFLIKVIRAILGMANQRDGGKVILGVESDPLDAVGFEEDEAKAWLNYDEPACKVNEYASPPVSFELEAFPYRGRHFIEILVHEFDDIPILCRKDAGQEGKGRPFLRRGACYVRALHKPETSEIPSEVEMRALLELAIDKGVEKLVRRAQRAGLFPTMQPSPMPADIEELFKDQAEDLQ